MAEETESAATLLARKEYARAVPLLKRDLDKYPSNPRIRLQYADGCVDWRDTYRGRAYPSNPRIRLQYADALAGVGHAEDAVVQYEQTAKYYEDNGLTVQAIAVRKKAEKVRELVPAAAKGKDQPLFERPLPK